MNSAYDTAYDGDYSDNVLPFRRCGLNTNRLVCDTSDDRLVVAVVTITRFIAGRRLGVQVPVYGDEIIPDTPPFSIKDTPELSELLANAAVEANRVLDRISARAAARPLSDFAAR